MPLGISANGRYLLDRGGQPLFWMGDTLWHLFRAFSPDEVRAILADRKAKGFNVLLVMLIGYEPETDPVPNVNGDHPWIDLDPSRLNGRYFDHVDALMRIACEMDFIQVLGVYHKNQDRFYTPQKARESARWIARRYRDVPHIIWSMYPEARDRYLPMVRAIVAGLQEGDGGSHMITVHPDPSPQSSSFVHDEKWLSFNMLQTWNEIEQVYRMVAADRSFVPIKPAIMAEGGYEQATSTGRHITPADIRRQAYWTFLAGGHLVYGHDLNWKAPTRWREWLDAPGTRYLASYRRIITSLPKWWDIIPDQSIIAQGVGQGQTLNAAARSLASDWALVYLSSPCTTTVRLDRLRASDTIVASWIGPTTEQRTRIGTFRYNEARPFTTPDGWEDALLLLQAE
jgi:hypothetical protein